MADVTPRQRDKHIRFIQANWGTLATIAFTGFKQHGRGMVYMEDDPFIEKPDGRLVKFKAAYVAEGSPAFHATGGHWPGEKEAGWVQGYDPNTTVLVCFARKDKGQSSYRIVGVPGHLPIECAQRTQASEN
jgi:hypothetical protein